MELWGGHECTVNRVGDRFRDQTELTGHHGRAGDLAIFAELGVRRLRYPVLWERVAPERPAEHDWRWSDERLTRIRQLGMKPIVGLLHHGSGPRYTSLVSDDFVRLFAGFAGAVAARYPHVADWTPVNEPLTTARFSTLYGLWYPHARDEALFWRALLNQVDGTRAAMKAVRRVNPAARLVQTEDLGRHYSTGELADTAEHLNHRRWATWDLLTGQVTREHALWSHLAALGLGDRLRAIADDPCPPDIVGVNHYPTSDRFLDHRTEPYPFAQPPEGYHDLTAMRVLDPPPPGLRGVLTEIWHRYRLPIAVTESHLGCTREEQLRWLWQSWQACRALVAEGVDVRAFTAWALLGNVDWNSLITREEGHYETGAFDIRGGQPRPTAIARLLKVLGSGAEPAAAAFPTVRGPGWWQRALRLEHPPFRCEGLTRTPSEAVTPPVAIAGGAPVLVRAFAQECDMRGLPYLVADRAMPIGDDPEQVSRWLDRHRPWAMIHVHRPLGEGVGRVGRYQAGHAPLARACAARGIACLVLSGDGAITAGDGALLVRSRALSPQAAGKNGQASGDEGFGRLVELARACLDLLVDDERGTWQVEDGVAEPIADGSAALVRHASGETARAEPAHP